MPAGSSTGVNTPRSSVNPWTTPLASKYSPATTPAWSVRHLDDEAARAFRLLGLHPGADFDTYAAAALTGTTLRQARWLLDRLARAHLIQPAGTGRYGMHDLLRAYAADQAADQDSEQERRAALSRLLDHYLATAAAAAGTLFRADPDQPALPQPAGPMPPVTSPAAALAWLDAQRSTLVAVAAHAADHGWPGHAIGLAATIFRYPDVGNFTDAAAMHSHARRAAAQAGDRAAEAAALTMLGAAEAAQGRLRQATSHLEQALALCREDGDRIGEARALGHLGLAGYCQGRYQQSAECHGNALAIYLEVGDDAGEARELHALGVVDLRQGRYQQAAGHLRRSLALFRGVGAGSGEAYVLGDLGELELRQGRYLQAVGHLRQSLRLGREIGQPAVPSPGAGLPGPFRAAAGPPPSGRRPSPAVAGPAQPGRQLLWSGRGAQWPRRSVPRREPGRPGQRSARRRAGPGDPVR